MNLAALKAALKPKLHEMTINGVTVHIHRPSISDAPKCSEFSNVLVLCVKDENGNPVFSHDDTLFNVNEVDQVFANEIYIAVLALVAQEDPVEDVEKKSE